MQVLLRGRLVEEGTLAEQALLLTILLEVVFELGSAEERSRENALVFALGLLTCHFLILGLVMIGNFFVATEDGLDPLEDAEEVLLWLRSFIHLLLAVIFHLIFLWRLLARRLGVR